MNIKEASNNPQLASALMLNQKSDIVANIDRERLPHTSIALPFFMTGITRDFKLRQVYLPNDKALVEYNLAPFNLHDPYSNNPAFRNRISYVICNMNSNESIEDDDRVKVRNNSPYMFRMILSKELKSFRSDKVYRNDWNSIFGVFNLRNALVPAALDLEIVKRHNQLSSKLCHFHKSFAEKYPGVDLGTFTSYRKVMEPLYQAYQAGLLQMYTEGLLSVTTAHSVVPNTLTGQKLMNSGSRSDNPYYDAESHLQNHISYVPMLNIAYGFADINSAAEVDDINPDLELGIRKLRQDAGDDVGLGGNGRQEAVRLAEVADTFGNKSSMLLRRQDSGYVNTRGGDKTLSEIFFNATNHNDQVYFSGRYAPTVAESGVNGTSTGLLRPSIVIETYLKPNLSKGIVQTLDATSEALDDAELDQSFEAALQSVLNPTDPANPIDPSVDIFADDSVDFSADPSTIVDPATDLFADPNEEVPAVDPAPAEPVKKSKRARL